MKRKELKRLIQKEVNSTLKEGPRHNKRYGEKPPSGAQVKRQFKDSVLSLVDLSTILHKTGRADLSRDAKTLSSELMRLQKEFEQEGLAEDCGEDHYELEEDYTGIDDDTGNGPAKGGSKRFNKNKKQVTDHLKGNDKGIDYE